MTSVLFFLLEILFAIAHSQTLVARYVFSGNFDDSSSNGYHLTNTNGHVLETITIMGPVVRIGKFFTGKKKKKKKKKKKLIFSVVLFSSSYEWAAVGPSLDRAEDWV
jgi:hypothetical protein